MVTSPLLGNLTRIVALDLSLPAPFKRAVQELTQLEPLGPCSVTVPVGEPAGRSPVTVTSTVTVDPGTGGEADGFLLA